METARLQHQLAAQVEPFSLLHRLHKPGKRRAHASNSRKSKLSNGHAVGFQGRIPGPNADGRAVTMQARVGRKWRSFKQLVTDTKGHFKGKYRFTQTRGRVSYLFRALVKKQGGYPYSAGASPKRKLVVHG